MKSISLTEKHKLFTKQWHPNPIAEGSRLQVYLSRVQGDLVMHTHENGAELYCLAATYLLQFVMDGNSDVTKLKNPIVLRYILDNVSENN